MSGEDGRTEFSFAECSLEPLLPASLMSLEPDAGTARGLVEGNGNDAMVGGRVLEDRDYVIF